MTPPSAGPNPVNQDAATLVPSLPPNLYSATPAPHLPANPGVIGQSPTLPAAAAPAPPPPTMMPPPPVISGSGSAEDSPMRRGLTRTQLGAGGGTLTPGVDMAEAMAKAVNTPAARTAAIANRAAHVGELMDSGNCCGDCASVHWSFFSSRWPVTKASTCVLGCFSGGFSYGKPQDACVAEFWLHFHVSLPMLVVTFVRQLCCRRVVRMTGGQHWEVSMCTVVQSK